MTIAFDDPDQAIEALLQIVEGLVPGDFCTQIQQKFDVCDLYAVRWDMRSWYVKFTVQEDTLVVCISIHPPTSPLKTVAGKLIK